jgi:hypothetical protein
MPESYHFLMISTISCEEPNIIKQFSTFTPACMGTSDGKYNSRALVNSSDINILAPIKYYRTVKEIVNINDEKAFIVPRNRNIKKIYVWLAFSSDYNNTERLINEPLHNRLKYKMISTLEEAFYEAQESLLNSPLGAFVSTAKEDYLSLIAKYVKEVEQYLFDPRKQDLIVGEDHITLPNFRPQTPTSSETNYEKRLELTLPKPPYFSRNGISYKDFEVYYVDPEFTKEQIVQDSISIVKNKRLLYMTSYNLLSRSSNPLDFALYNNLFLIFHSERYNSNISEAERKTILDYIMTKYLIDYYKEQEYSYETITAMFPSLNTAGMFYLFMDYYNTSYEEDIIYPSEKGINRELSTIPFYNQVLTNNGGIIKIEETGVNIYDVFGEKTRSIYDVPGNVVGLSVIDNDTYLLSLNKQTGGLEAYYSPDNGITTLKMAGDANNANIYPGIGFTSLHQINFYESVYYNDILFIIHENKIKYTENRIDFNILNVSFPNEQILGLSFLPNNDLYILTNAYVYVIENFDISLNAFNVRKLQENDNKFIILKGVVGTIVTAVSIPLNTVDDFDIDDKNVINRLLMYYNSMRLSYYWHSAHSEISLEMFDNNIARLQELILTTTDNDRIATIQRCIERQNYFKSKMS